MVAYDGNAERLSLALAKTFLVALYCEAGRIGRALAQPVADLYGSVVIEGGLDGQTRNSPKPVDATLGRRGGLGGWRVARDHRLRSWGRGRSEAADDKRQRQRHGALFQ